MCLGCSFRIWPIETSLPGRLGSKATSSCHSSRWSQALGDEPHRLEDVQPPPWRGEDGGLRRVSRPIHRGRQAPWRRSPLWVSTVSGNGSAKEVTERGGFGGIRLGGTVDPSFLGFEGVCRRMLLKALQKRKAKIIVASCLCNRSTPAFGSCRAFFIDGGTSVCTQNRTPTLLGGNPKWTAYQFALTGRIPCLFL